MWSSGRGVRFKSNSQLKTMDQKPIYLTLSGLPISFEFEWPFHPSTSGADFRVLHGRATLEDNSGLHADFAIHLSQTMQALLPSLDPASAQPFAINVVRKTVETKDLEFLRSGKRQPIPLSSRFKNMKQNAWRFMEADEQQIRVMLRATVYWVGHKLGRERVLIADDTNALYVGTSSARLLEIAKPLAAEGLIRLEGEYAFPTQAMITRASEFEGEEEQALRTLQEKHAFENVKR